MLGKKEIKFFVCFIILLLILPVNVSAFVRIKPQLALISVSTDGYFSGAFTNAAGGPIRVTGVGGKIVGASSQCVGAPQYPREPIEVGENFMVELSGCAQGLSAHIGDPYSFSVRMDYEVELNEEKVVRVDGGTLRGPYEGESGKPVVTRPDEIVSYPTEEKVGKKALNLWFLLNPDLVIPLFLTIIIVFSLLVKHKKINFQTYKKKILTAIAFLILIFLLYSYYILNIEDFTSKQQTLLFSQKQFTQDSVVSFRVIALDSSTQNPLKDVKVSVKLKPIEGGLRASKEVYSGFTGPSGSAEVRFNLSEEWGEGEYEVSVTVGDDTLKEKIRVIRNSKILLTTDKPIYQPNQLIHIRALVLKPFNLKPYANRTIVFEVEDSKANKIFKKEVDTNKFGVSSTQLALADDINLGRYTIRAIFGDSVQEKKIDVKKYALPKFKIDFTSDKPYYLPDEEVNALISPHYFFGKSVANGQVDIRVLSYEIDFKEFQHIQGKTNEDGAFSFKVDLPSYFIGMPLEKGNTFVVFNITVTDATGNSESILRMLPVTRELILVEAFPESEKLKKNLENTVFVITSYPDGTPAETTLNVNGKTMKTNQLGIASFTTKPTSSAVYKLFIEAEDGKGRKTYVQKEFSSEGGTEHMILKSDKIVYNVGDTAVFNCIYSGMYGTKSVYIDLIKNKQTILTKAIDLENNRATLGVDLTQDMVGTLEVHCYKTLRSTDIVRDVKHIIVNEPKDLEVDVGTDKNVYLPGEDAKISLHVTGNEGGVQSAVGINIVDESAYALEELHPGFEKLYFILEKELMTPRYQIKIFSPYELVDRISRKESLNLTVIAPVPLVEAEKAAQVLIKVANLTSTDYDLKRDSYIQKTAEIMKTKQDYWSGLGNWIWRFIVWVFRTLLVLYAIYFLRGLYRIFKVGDKFWTFLIITLLLIITVIYSAENLSYKTRRSLNYNDYDEFLYLSGAVLIIISLIGIPSYNLREKHKKGYYLILVPLLLFPLFVVWQLGVFNLGGVTSTTSTGGIDESLLTQSTVISREAAEAEGKPYLRQFFPETLYFNPSVITDENGRADISLQMADSITTWRLNALASSLDGRLGSKTSGIRVFQDFFIDANLPRILTQGDEVWVPIALYNYLDEPQDVRLELTESDWFTLLDTNSKTITLKPNEVSVEFYHIKAERHGMHKITVYAYGDEMSDAISRQVEVEPYGEEVRSSVSGVLDEDVSEDIFIPEHAIDGTEKIMVKIYPGYFSQVVEGLDKILRMPFGCFEQTTSITYPNVLVLDYMKKTEQITPELQMRAEHFVSTGYQRLMNFETSTPGGFDWYGNPPPKLLLTAYGLLEFKDMSEVYNVDPDLIPRTQRWLASQQNRDGSWEPKQYLRFSRNMANSKLTSTCFVTWSLAHSGYTGGELNRGLSYIKGNMVYGDSADPYTLALCANALLENDEKDPTAKRILERLHEARVEDENNLTYWKSPDSQQGYETWTGSRDSMKDLETTALTSLAYMQAGYKPQTIYRILDYLVTKKDSYGTWSSTQATILSLKAFVHAAEHLKEMKFNATATIHLNGESVMAVRVDETTSDIVRFIDLGSETKKGSNKLKIKYEGDGNLYYQITGKYYSPWEKQKESSQPLKIEVEYSTKTLKINDLATIKTKITYTGLGTLKLVIVDLGIPPGFSIITEDLDNLKEAGIISRYDIAGRQLILYVQQLESNKSLNLSYRAKAMYPIKAHSPKSQVYEYYNPEVRDIAQPVELHVTS